MPIERARSVQTVVWAVTLGPALLMALLGACGSDQTDPPPAPQAASVVLTPASATLLELDSFAISVTVLDPAGRVLSGRTINWESSDYSIATPQAPSAGWVQAGIPGTATIRASVSPENVFGTTEVTVLERPKASVVVTSSVDTLDLGGLRWFVPQAYDTSGQVIFDVTYSWPSADHP